MHPAFFVFQDSIPDPAASVKGFFPGYFFILEPHPAFWSGYACA